MPITEVNDPLTLFHNWLQEAEEKEENVPTAACLATSNTNAIPSARMVLLKSADDRGFVFYTNLDSRKGGEIRQNPHAALCFHWKSLDRQVRVEGTVTLVSETDADAYFATRPRDAQIGAWASLQSRPLRSRSQLENQVAEYSAKFALGPVPRPGHWSGYCLNPTNIEFWENRSSRLHDRLKYERTKDRWRHEWLFP
tara:strand:- start:231 stop:821 length:591 start_codon:yes stop_codon:yes gene_type:complete